MVTDPPDQQVETAQDGLEQCRRNMEADERDLRATIARLKAEALLKKKLGDLPGARYVASAG